MMMVMMMVMNLTVCSGWMDGVCLYLDKTGTDDQIAI